MPRARDLSPSDRRAVWEHIKHTDPDLADGLANDPVVTALRDQLGATPVFSKDLVAAATAHKNNQE